MSKEYIACLKDRVKLLEREIVKHAAESKHPHNIMLIDKVNLGFQYEKELERRYLSRKNKYGYDKTVLRD